MTRQTHVWYAAYGSNCDPARFNCYLSGGRPAGSTKTHAGCRDTTQPSDTRPVTLARSMYFGGWSPYWGGAVAYLNPTTDTDPEAATLAVARRITAAQFCDVVAQECGGLALSADIPIQDLLAAGRVDVGGAYGTVLALGSIDGEPVVTCTAGARRRAGEPTSDYLDTIRRGLTGHWPAVVVDTYLDDLYSRSLVAAAAARATTRTGQLTLPPEWPVWPDDPDDLHEWDRLDDPWDDQAGITRDGPWRDDRLAGV